MVRSTLSLLLAGGLLTGGALAGCAAPDQLADGGGFTSAQAATCSLPASIMGRDVTTIPTTKKIVAFTFDAGANADGVARILAKLERNNARGSFFLTGRFVDQFPAESRAMAAYPVGNHTNTHPDLTTLTDAQVLEEIRRGHNRIKRVSGQDPHPYFRFPFGAVNARTLGLVNSRCYVAVRWTVDTLGWKGTSGGMTKQKVLDRIESGLRPGAIILMHVGSNPTDGSTLDAAVLGRAIELVRERGYRPVTLAKLAPTGE